jgi:hypothetical protein
LHELLQLFLREGTTRRKGKAPRKRSLPTHSAQSSLQYLLQPATRVTTCNNIKKWENYDDDNNKYNNNNSNNDNDNKSNSNSNSNNSYDDNNNNDNNNNKS